MATSPRSLRIGVLLNGQLVEERLFSGAAPVTFGQSLRCALNIPVEGVPFEHTLFTREGDHFTLHETSRMEVKRADRRGRIALGDVTILFQEVATPPPAPRPQLPAAIRGSFMDRIDKRLALFVGGSLLVHIGIATWAWTNDVANATLGLPPVAQTYHEEIIDITVPDESPVPTNPTEPGKPAVATPVTSHQTSRPIVRPTNIQHPTSGDDAQRLASILAGDTESETGRGGMHGRQPGVDLNKQIDDARNHTIAIGDGTHTSRTDDREHMGTVDHHIVDDDPSLTRTPDRHDEPHLPGRVVIGPVKPDDSTSLTPAVVLERINTLYMAGLQRCYREGLRTDATLTGRVAISFTVDERGQVADPSASGVSTGVDACVQSQMAKWRFPVPKDKQGAPTDASFAVSLALQPS